MSLSDNHFSGNRNLLNGYSVPASVRSLAKYLSRNQVMPKRNASRRVINRTRFAASVRKPVTRKAAARAPARARRPRAKYTKRRMMKPKISFEDKVLKAMTPLQSYSVNYNVALASVDNQCAYNPLSVLYSQVDVANCFTISGLSTATNATHIDVETATQETRLANAGNTMIDVEAYLCTPRRDVPSAFPQGGTLIANGFTTSGITAGTSDVSINIFQSKDFVELYKIVKTLKFRMMPGHEKKLSIKGSPFRVQKLYTSNTFYQYRGKSKFWVLRTMGEVANDSTTKTNVGYSGSKLDVVQNERYNFRFVTPLVSQHATAGLLGAITTAQVINPYTDAGILEATA